jgi:hypothetical protein
MAPISVGWEAQHFGQERCRRLTVLSQQDRMIEIDSHEGLLQIGEGGVALSLG